MMNVVSQLINPNFPEGDDSRPARDKSNILSLEIMLS